MSENALLEFLKDVELVADTELKEQECIDFLYGLNDLQSISRLDLENKIKKYIPSIETNDQEIEKLVSTIKHIKSSEAFFTYIGQQELTALLLILSKEYNDQYKGEALLTKTGAGIRIFIAIELKRIVLQLKENPDLHLLEDVSYEIIKLIHRLGVLQGLLSGIKMAHNVSDKLLIHEMIHSLVSGKSVIKRRWDIKDAIQNKVSEVANKLYQNGDERYHHKMADYLEERFRDMLNRCEKGEQVKDKDIVDKAFRQFLNKLKNEYPDLNWKHIEKKIPSRNGFLVATKNAARKYDRVLGAWGLRTKKSDLTKKNPQFSQFFLIFFASL